jgi:hypothetical protein
VEPSRIDALIPQLSLVLGPMTAGLKGFHLRLDGLQFDVETMQPTAIEGSLLAAVDDPRGVFALAAMFNPALGSMDIPTDGRLVDLPTELVPDRETPPMKVAISDGRLLLVAGPETAREAAARLDAPSAEPPVLFVFDYGLRQFVDRLDGPLRRAIAQLAASGEDELAVQLDSQLADFRRQSEVFERLDFSMRGETVGLVAEQTIRLR